ncbi:MAG: YjgP/YjgQ family permease [Spirochaetia bacterium]|nr:YjgP/YjgQ family permease [Spirochaetia bacterium]
MRVLRNYLTASFIRLVTITTLLLSFILLLFDLFSNLEQYLQVGAPLLSILYATVLYLPESIVFAFAPSALFASTYILAMMHTHNEMIILNNSGISFKKIVRIFIVTSLFLSLLQFAFNEYVTIKANILKSEYTADLLDTSISKDSRNITLYGLDKSYIVYAKRFSERENKITGVSLYHLEPNGSLIERADATSGIYNEGQWTLNAVNLYSIDETTNEVTYQHLTTYTPLYLTLNPSFFANKSNDVLNMPLKEALSYLESIKVVKKGEYSVIATEVYNRIFKNLAPLILILISCSTVFAWKKNVLILSIITSISIGVVYYVLLLIGMILAKQGVIMPILGTLGPMTLLTLSSIFTLILKRN